MTHGRTAGAARHTVRLFADNLFSGVGHWACVARSVGGIDHPQRGPWSKPTPTRVVQQGFYGAGPGKIRLRDSKGPRYEITEQLDKHDAGGLAHLSIKRSGGAGKVKARGRVRKDGLVAFHFRLPELSPSESSAHWVASLAFDGNRFVAPRPYFGEFAVDLLRSGGGTQASFTPPCAPHRC